MLFEVLSKVQVDKFTVPLKGDMMVNSCLAEDVPYIFYNTNTHPALINKSSQLFNLVL